YASVFVSLLPREMSLPLAALLTGMIFAIEGGWYAIVALALSAERSRNLYLGWKTTIDRLAGGVMIALGIKLLSERV
ncbi:MAG TPA: LysE family translocator, partial [Rhodocyclaceae bacterium]|nr:LysE family translocator [Rhodocyclaceae bacterium]